MWPQIMKKQSPEYHFIKGGIPFIILPDNGRQRGSVSSRYRLQIPNKKVKAMFYTSAVKSTRSKCFSLFVYE